MAFLDFDWELVSGRHVVAFMGRNERRMDHAGVVWDELAIVLGENAVILSVNDDTDEITVTLCSMPSGNDWLKVEPLSRYATKKLGWCWEITNYRGYSDGFIVAFGDVLPDAIEPKLTFLGEGSAIACFQMTAVN